MLLDDIPRYDRKAIHSGSSRGFPPKKLRWAPRCSSQCILLCQWQIRRSIALCSGQLCNSGRFTPSAAMVLYSRGRQRPPKMRMIPRTNRHPLHQNLQALLNQSQLHGGAYMSGTTSTFPIQKLSPHRFTLRPTSSS